MGEQRAQVGRCDSGPWRTVEHGELEGVPEGDAAEAGGGVVGQLDGGEEHRLVEAVLHDVARPLGGETEGGDGGGGREGCGGMAG